MTIESNSPAPAPARPLGPLKNRPFRQRLGFALAGIVAVERCERSFRTQRRLALLALAAGAFLRVPLLWWATLMLSIGFVLALECLNGALEYALDHLHPDHHPEIGRAKDAAAGAVLIASLASVAVGAAMILARLA
jgi:undecaprenol kinase